MGGAFDVPIGVAVMNNRFARQAGESVRREYKTAGHSYARRHPPGTRVKPAASRQRATNQFLQREIAEEEDVEGNSPQNGLRHSSGTP
jgi:hypothetical protein